MVLNGVIRELEYRIEFSSDEENKFSKSLSLLDEIKDYSDKIKKLLIKINQKILNESKKV